MLLCDKLVILRKKKGLSQEELAEKLNVTRQSVSKWEGGLSTPDLEKIVQLSELYGVTLDYLVKDEHSAVDDDESVNNAIKQSPPYEPVTVKKPVRKLSDNEVEKYLNFNKRFAKWLALSISLCIIGVAVLILMLALSSPPVAVMSEVVSLIVGFSVMIVMVACGVGFIIYNGIMAYKFKISDDEEFELEEQTTERLKSEKEAYLPKMARTNIIAIVLCIVAVLPVIITGIIFSQSGGELVLFAVVALLVIVSVAVDLFVIVVVKWNTLQKLLKEGEYTETGKAKNKLLDIIAEIFWPIIVAIYLAYSFITKDWGRSWIIWPVAGVLFACVSGIVNLVIERKNKKK